MPSLTEFLSCRRFGTAAAGMAQYREDDSSPTFAAGTQAWTRSKRATTASDLRYIPLL
jgi:hypothetical protein